MSQVHKGKTYTADTKALISIAKSGENHPNYGKTGENCSMYGRKGQNHPMYDSTGNNSSVSKKVFVYSN